MRPGITAAARAGKFLFMQYPAIASALSPLNAVARLYFGIPFAGLIVFFALYMGVVNNQNLGRGVRFNALQAILLDIILMCASHSMHLLAF